MNLAIMNYEDIITYYRPKTTEEAYIIDEMREAYNDLKLLNESLEDIKDEINELKNEIKSLDTVIELLNEAKNETI